VNTAPVTAAPTGLVSNRADARGIGLVDDVSPHAARPIAAMPVRIELRTEKTSG